MSERPSNSPSIFHQPWWLDAVAPGKWKIIEIKRGGELYASMPYTEESKLGVSLSTMPSLTQHLGPWIKPLDGTDAAILAKEKELFTEIIQQLPDFGFFRQRFSTKITNWLPFYWDGFNQTTRYTYRLNDLSDEDKIWAGLQGNIRREIKKAQKQVSIEFTDDASIMWKLWNLNFQKKNQTVKTSKATFERINQACIDNHCRKIFIAKDDDNNVHASLFLVWDSESAYYLIGGADPEFRNSGAASLLMYEAIKFASTVTNSFDFEGSMIESVERFFRGFGAVQTPYFEISKATGIVKPLLAMKDLL